jgi:antitoxin (DNA-binding transcriptional repressor) of toxin-antitoxin stability system
MKTMSLAAAQAHLDELVSALNEGPVLLLRKGQPCAALVGLSEQFDREAFTLGRNERLRRLVDEACRKTRKEGGIPFSEILAEVEKNPARTKAKPARPRGTDS